MKAGARLRIWAKSCKIGTWTRVWGMIRGEKARLAALLAFIFLVAVMGGGSRSDILSLVFLRPCAVFFASYALICMTGEQFLRVRPILLILLVFMGYTLLQLVPLPPSVWIELPNRQTLADFSRAVGIELAYRPISLDPNKTWNGFFAMFVPLAAISLAAIQSNKNSKYILPRPAASIP